MRRQLGYRRRRPRRDAVTPFLLRLPPKHKQALDAEAAVRGISLAAYVRDVLAKHLQRIHSKK